MLKGNNKVKVKVKSCLTFCNPMDCSLSGSSVHGIFQARVLEWIAISREWQKQYAFDTTVCSFPMM